MCVFRRDRKYVVERVFTVFGKRGKKNKMKIVLFLEYNVRDGKENYFI